MKATTLTLKLSLENAAFEDNPGAESARILRELAAKVEFWHNDQHLGIAAIDINGNTVGRLVAR